MDLLSALERMSSICDLVSVIADYWNGIVFPFQLEAFRDYTLMTVVVKVLQVVFCPDEFLPQVALPGQTLHKPIFEIGQVNSRLPRQNLIIWFFRGSIRPTLTPKCVEVSISSWLMLGATPQPALIKENVAPGWAYCHSILSRCISFLYNLRFNQVNPVKKLLYWGLSSYDIQS